MIKVLIADDQELIREGLKIVLESKEHLKVTGAVSNGQEVIRSVREITPDIILMDIRMPKMDGVQCTKIIKELNPDIATKVVRLFSQMAKSDYTIHVENKYISDLTKAEWKIIREVGKGASNKEIAETLFLSEGTIRNYLSTILGKLQLRDRTQLAIWAVQLPDLNSYCD